MFYYQGYLRKEAAISQIKYSEYSKNKTLYTLFHFRRKQRTLKVRAHSSAAHDIAYFRNQVTVAGQKIMQLPRYFPE